MKLMHVFLTLTLLFCFSNVGISQQNESIKKQLKESYEQAMHYKKISLYGESIGELDKIIQLATKHGFEAETIKASIEKAELFRKTENFDRGIELLDQLKNTEKYPKLHVQKLGRLAALYAEYGDFPEEVAKDSVKVFTAEALEIAIRLNLKAEEAGLRNEIGFAQNRAREFEIALENLQKSAELYSQIGDEQNETGVQTNILDLYTSKDEFQKCDSLYPILVQKIKDTPWYSAKGKLYRIISMRYIDDSLLHLQWAEKAHQATVEQIRSINSNQMASFKVIHDTNKFKEEALKKTVDLEHQKAKTQQLSLYISILALVVIIVVFIILREKRLKSKLDVMVKDLNTLNDKHEMLIVESNHRIKNNLQMIISMLEFTGKGIENSKTDTIKSLSGKIQTIGALHNFLYLDIHNENVNLGAYFSEILKHYRQIGLKHGISKLNTKVEIKSERIVYFGLILNEMLSNTLEHSKLDPPQIELKIEEQGDGFLFKYSDGSPHPEDAREGTGTKLIHQLIKRIKGSNSEMHRDSGTYLFNFTSDS